MDVSGYYSGFYSAHPVFQAFLATLFTWAATAAGASAVFAAKGVNKKVLDGMLGFAAGVMIAASFWSLLAPSIEMASSMGIPAWFPAASGFILGGVFLRVVDSILPHLHLNFPMDEAEGVRTSWRRTTLLVLAVTLHNIPEGLAIGVAFGAAAAGYPSATLAGAITLAVGIGIQNFPEGMAVAMPLRREGLSRLKSFWYGQLSGVAEIVAGVTGAAATFLFHSILPYALAFAAGAMIFVVVEEVVPESQREGNADIATMAAMMGFTVMMVLDVAFG